MAELQLNCNLWLGMEIIVSDEPDSNVVWCLVYQLECVHFHSSAAGQQIVFVSVLGRDLVRLPCCCGQGRLGLGWGGGEGGGQKTGHYVYIS